MTTLRTGGVAALLLTALLTAGCSATAPTTTTEPAPDPYATEDTDADVQPGTEICEIKSDWEAVDALLIKAARENPPAPSYTDAMYRLQAVFPPDSIEDEWLDLRTRVEDYVPIITVGDPAVLKEQTDEVTAISEAQLTLFSYFQALCP